MKRSKYSFHDFSAKHTPSATLNYFAPSKIHYETKICSLAIGVKGEEIKQKQIYLYQELDRYLLLYFRFGRALLREEEPKKKGMKK